MGGHDPKQPSEPGESAPEIPYATKRNPITGAITVHYKCRQCSAPLQLDTRLEKLNATQGDQHGQR